MARPAVRSRQALPPQRVKPCRSGPKHVTLARLKFADRRRLGGEREIQTVQTTTQKRRVFHVAYRSSSAQLRAEHPESECLGPEWPPVERRRSTVDRRPV